MLKITFPKIHGLTRKLFGMQSEKENMNRLKQIDGFKWERIDAVKLRGKETQVELFSVINDPS